MKITKAQLFEERMEYFNMFFDNLYKYGESNEVCYQRTEKEFQKKYNRGKYVNYASFRQGKSRNAQEIKTKNRRK